MTDVHEPGVRSYNMSRIRSTDTKPELLVRKFLFRNGFRYRLYVKDLPGKPDIVLPKYKTVIFVNGCFWHYQKRYRYFVLPKNTSCGSSLNSHHPLVQIAFGNLIQRLQLKCIFAILEASIVICMFFLLR